MISQILTIVAMFYVTMVGLGVISLPHIPVDLIVGRAYLLPIILFHGIPDLVASIVRVIPLLLLLPFIFLFAAGFMALKEID